MDLHNLIDPAIRQALEDLESECKNNEAQLHAINDALTKRIELLEQQVNALLNVPPQTGHILPFSGNDKP